MPENFDNVYTIEGHGSKGWEVVQTYPNTLEGYQDCLDEFDHYIFDVYAAEAVYGYKFYRMTTPINPSRYREDD